MTEVTTLYGLLAVIITSIGTPITLHILQRKKTDKLNNILTERNISSENKIDFLVNQIKESNLATQRVDMIMFMNSNPYESCTDSQKARIQKKYLKYQSDGGNDWFDEVYDNWMYGITNTYSSNILNELVSFCSKQHKHEFKTVKNKKNNQ